MKKLQITKEQYDRLFPKAINEDTQVRGGVNRVDKSIKKTFNAANVQNLGEDEFNIKAQQTGIPKSAMKPKSEPKPIQRISEDIGAPELQHAISKFIENVWMNPSQQGLDRIFVENGVNWGDIATYLTSIGVLSVIGGGIFKVNNFFKRHFSKDSKEATTQKVEDINKMATIAAKDPKAPWSAFKGVDLGKSFEKMKGMEEEGSNYPAGTENNPTSPWNQQGPELDEPSSAPKMFKPVEMSKEIAILNAPSGMYLFDYADIDRKEFPNTEYELDIEDITDYVNHNLARISKGDGLDGFNAGAQLVKIDEPLKEELINLYSYDKKLVSVLSRLQEMTGSGSSGAFTGPLSGPAKPVDKGLNPSEDLMGEEAIEETTGSASSGSYVQPQIWAKDKANWKGAAATQYPNGEMVDINSCTKLNNNKQAQKGKCSVGAVDNVVKTHKTKNSVISPSLSENKIYEAIAKKTGKKVDEIKKIIEGKVNKDKSLT
jgi:hypothetical protein